MSTICLHKKCNLAYIPAKLHWNNKKAINEFFLNEELYWRCKEEKFSNPYAEISLADVSINRQGNPCAPISEPQDALYNLTDSKNEKYDCGIIILEIKEISKPYIKKYEDIDGNENIHKLEMELIHDPLNCMYPHSLFKFRLNGQDVTMSNYDSTLKKSNKAISRLRKRCKDELTRMIKTKIVKF
ncbi:MAG: hypothetical protein A2W98_12345 [Bacteroidetes bacterium GWF2_33_38]|nr:MAG: hypothetical protein A2W98_12345 [Bacteroidetes bacterium GWF2_33_38]OFY88494.1 MAG: hypothetical protein A2236_09485 [Bacteroidetes bacterium RIFOXYA2_FULL_33_7]